jgi:hypothetical protein
MLGWRGIWSGLHQYHADQTGMPRGWHGEKAQAITIKTLWLKDSVCVQCSYCQLKPECGGVVHHIAAQQLDRRVLQHI